MLFRTLFIFCLSFLYSNNSVVSEERVIEVDRELIGNTKKNDTDNNDENKNKQNVEKISAYNDNEEVKPIIKTNSKQKNVKSNLDKYTDEFYDNFSIMDEQSRKNKKPAKFDIKVVDISNTKDGVFTSNLKKGYNCYKNGDYELAVFYYKKALEENKDSIESQFGIAVSYQMLHQYDQAISYYLNILSKNFSRRKIVNNLLLCLSHKSYSEALDILLSINDNILGYSDIISQIGLIYMKLGNNGKALSALNRAYELSKNNAVIAYNLGVLYDKEGNLDYAKHFYEIAIKNDISDILPLDDYKQLENRAKEIDEQILFEINEKKEKDNKNK